MGSVKQEIILAYIISFSLIFVGFFLGYIIGEKDITRAPISMVVEKVDSISEEPFTNISLKGFIEECSTMDYEQDIIQCYEDFVGEYLFYTKGNKFSNMDLLLQEGANCFGAAEFGKGFARKIENVSAYTMDIYPESMADWGHRIYALVGNNGYYCVFSNNIKIGCSQLKINEGVAT